MYLLKVLKMKRLDIEYFKGATNEEEKVHFPVFYLIFPLYHIQIKAATLCPGYNWITNFLNFSHLTFNLENGIGREEINIMGMG